MCGFYPLFHSVLYIILYVFFWGGGADYGLPASAVVAPPSLCFLPAPSLTHPRPPPPPRQPPHQTNTKPPPTPHSQIAGAIFGSLLAAGLIPGLRVGAGADFGIGCFGGGTLAKGLTKGQLFGWEAIMTFFLISCVYACGIAKPGHGSHTPLAVGLVLLACAGTGGRFTGAALNPARVIGPLAVFHCGKDSAWIYILAQLFAALCACAIFAVVSGFGPLTPFSSMKSLGLTWMEAVRMWMTGSPPARLRTDGDENVTELLQRQEDGQRAGEAAQRAKLSAGIKSIGTTLTNSLTKRNNATAAAADAAV